MRMCAGVLPRSSSFVLSSSSAPLCLGVERLSEKTLERQRNRVRVILSNFIAAKERTAKRKNKCNYACWVCCNVTFAFVQSTWLLKLLTQLKSSIFKPDAAKKTTNTFECTSASAWVLLPVVDGDVVFVQDSIDERSQKNWKMRPPWKVRPGRSAFPSARPSTTPDHREVSMRRRARARARTVENR